MILGKKTGLRSVEKEDLQMLRDWRNKDDFRKHFREFRELNMSNQEAWFDKTNQASGDFMFVIESLNENRPIGACGLLYINWIIRSADFSFYLGADDQYIDDKGIAEDASRTLINYGFRTLNLNKIWMELYEFDTKKLDLYQKLGFKIDGKLRSNCFYNGKYHDSFLLSLLAEEF
ncbi:MAG: GNAT family N-acetyltransferase [Bacteroidetes bacterium]|nr:GNAT family N-acetyltransferase [Bacteroidota bacterium]